MSQMERLLDLLPPSYSVAGDSVLFMWLSALAAELEVAQEDIDRVRRTHWVRLAYEIEDVEKLAELMGTRRLPWETLPVFRERLLARIKALLRGALGPREIRTFVYDYLSGAEDALGCTLVPGLRTVDAEESYRIPADRPHFRPLAFVENPAVERTSATLGPHGGYVPYLCRWEEVNRGLFETTVSFGLVGLSGGRTAVPVLVNLTTGDMIGYAGRLGVGQMLEIAEAPEATDRTAAATLDSGASDGSGPGRRDVTGKLFSMSGFELGVPFEQADLDPQPQLPRLARGPNQWLFLSVGLFDIRGLNHFFFAIADGQLREGAYDQTSFDHALFQSGTAARLWMAWTERVPAAFEVQVPRYLAVAPAGQVTSAGELPFYEQVGQALQASIGDLHAAGVQAGVRFMPFAEVQPQRARVTLPWRTLEPELAPAGANERISLGARFGESGLDDSRFE